MISRVISKTVDLAKVQKVDQLEGPLYQLEQDGHTFEITCLMNGEAATSISGTVSARFLRADEETVIVSGTLSGNVVSVTLPQSCYTVNGRFGMVIFVSGSDVTTAVYAVAGSVYRSTSNTIVDPGSVIPSLEDLLAQIGACQAATTAATNAAAFVPNIIAPAYSASATYAVGDYCTKDNLFYRCTTAITTAEAWTAGHWMQVTAGAELGQLSGEIGDAKSAITQITKACYKVIATKGASANTFGPLIPFVAKNGDSITAKATDDSTFGNVQLRFYDSEKTYIYHWTLSSGYGKTRTFTYNKETDAAYVGVTTVDASSPSDYLVLNNSNIYWQDILGLQNSVDAHYTEFKEFEDRACEKEIINRFNKETISVGKYISITDGTLASNSGFFASDFIYIGDLNSVTVSKTHLFCWYDASKNHLTPNPDPMNSRTNDLTFTRPQNAVYLRFSTYNEDLNSAQVGGNISKDNYVPYGIYKLPELRISETQIVKTDDSRIIVDASGSGDYTSFTEAIYDTVDDGIDVFVKPGTYNIVSEYVALFGQDAVDSMADADSSTFNGFQYGVRLRNRKIEFAPGAHLVCDWTGHTVDGTHRFSALGVDYNVEVIGLDLDCTATFYCIHDDYGISTPYTVKYENCRVVGHSIVNANCIGGGCKKYSRHILKNCYFDNNLTGSATVRYHNTNADGAEPEIYVSDCYFNNWFTPRWYGTQTSKMRVYVNNCEARSIHKLAESSSYNVDNVELYKWCNTETNPVT